MIPKEYFDGSRGTLKLLWEEEWRALGITQVRQPPWNKACPNTDGYTESGMGTLRGPRAGASYPSVQVGGKLRAR